MLKRFIVVHWLTQRWIDRFNVDGNYCLTCGSNKTIKLWNPENKVIFSLIQRYLFKICINLKRVNSFCFIFWNLKQFQCQDSIWLIFELFYLKFNPISNDAILGDIMCSNRRYLYAFERQILFWLKLFQVLLKTYLGHGQDVLDVRGSCDNSQLVSCGKDKLVVVWDVSTGSPLRKYRGLCLPLYATKTTFFKVDKILIHVSYKTVDLFFILSG